MSTISALRSTHFDGAAAIDGSSGKSPTLYDVIKELGNAVGEKYSKLAADGAAGTATAESPFTRAVTYDRRVKSIVYAPGAALTANNANYATLRVRKRTAAGADGGIIASLTTQITGTGDWVAFVVKALTLDTSLDSNLDLLAGELLTFEITKTGTGVVVPLGMLQAVFE